MSKTFAAQNISDKFSIFVLAHQTIMPQLKCCLTGSSPNVFHHLLDVSGSSKPASLYSSYRKIKHFLKFEFNPEKEKQLIPHS